MIVDRHDPINLFEMVPKLNLEFEPELEELDEMLEDEDCSSLLRQVFLNVTPTPRDSDAIPRQWRWS